ncbi:hypothetical protein L6452_32784 [Arctium lappa]|uniref:Uncharacterized protein n=1 Tax=Arctium lappa TaxID=4217 RepID=A0ACB8Z5L6_ARCLA|nr:hypothetical protein L6452_32784 [Arctium lappa]
MNHNIFRRISGYVTQEDLLFLFLIVEETLLYSTLLRLHGERTDTKARVRDLLEELGLQNVTGERIEAGTHHGISGCEKQQPRSLTQIRILHFSHGVLCLL